MRSIFALAAGLALLVAGAARAEDAKLVGTVIRKIPRTEAELTAAHAANKANSPILIPAGAPLEVPPFTDRIAYQIERGSGKPETVLYETGRQGALAFGMDMLEIDRADLPFISGNTILEHVTGEYILLEGRVQREPGGTPYLYYRPTAAVGSYDDPNKAKAFAGMMETSIGDTRSLGLFVPPGEEISPETMRTMVVVQRSEISDPNAPKKSKDKERPPVKVAYELAFVRARITGPADKPEISLHTFATSEGRANLRYLKPFTIPKSPDDCALVSMIYFTEYGFANIYPLASVARTTIARSQSTFTMAELNEYAARQGWQGDALDNLTQVLDAIIDKRITPKSPPPVAEHTPTKPGELATPKANN
jgi:hypothetical protein